jgi:hypothetical protein
VTRIIPNEETWVGFSAAKPAGWTLGALTGTITEAELDGAVNLTPFIQSITLGARGNTVPTPSLDSLFNRTVPGTADAQASGQFYRRKGAGLDLAWTTLKRGVAGYLFVSRFGGTGLLKIPRAGDLGVEAWPVQVLSRSGDQLTSGQVQGFACDMAVNEIPLEDGVTIASSSGAPSVVQGLAVRAIATGAILSWDTPNYPGAGGLGAYRVFQATAANGAGMVSGGTALVAGANFVQQIGASGVTAQINGLTTGTAYYFSVAAVSVTGTVESTRTIVGPVTAL